MFRHGPHMTLEQVIDDIYFQLKKLRSSTVSVSSSSSPSLGEQFQVTITDSYTVLSNDNMILCNHSAPITVTLPSPHSGRTIIVKDLTGNAASNTITLQPSSGDLIDNQSNFVMDVNYMAVTLISVGNDWVVT